jgi:hypothetical protein
MVCGFCNWTDRVMTNSMIKFESNELTIDRSR